MRYWIAIISMIFIGLWIGLSLILIGFINFPFLALEMPGSMAEFGDSLGILNGLFSSVAVILALVAVYFQGQELKEATQAQKEQAEALRQQIDNQKFINEQQTQRHEIMSQQLQQQQQIIEISQLNTMLHYHSSEITRMDKIIDRNINHLDQQELVKNCRNKRKEHLNKQKIITNKLDRITTENN